MVWRLHSNNIKLPETKTSSVENLQIKRKCRILHQLGLSFSLRNRKQCKTISANNTSNGFNLFRNIIMIQKRQTFIPVSDLIMYTGWIIWNMKTFFVPIAPKANEPFDSMTQASLGECKRKCIFPLSGTVYRAIYNHKQRCRKRDCESAYTSGNQLSSPKWKSNLPSKVHHVG